MDGEKDREWKGWTVSVIKIMREKQMEGFTKGRKKEGETNEKKDGR